MMMTAPSMWPSSLDFMFVPSRKVNVIVRPSLLTAVATSRGWLRATQ